MIVTLTWPDLRTAAYLGIDRWIRNLANGRRDRYGDGTGQDWRAHVVGAWGECAVAQATDHYWTERGAPDRGAPDVGPFHVRTAPDPRHCLILHDRDDDGAVFVLALAVTLPTVDIVGWCYGHEGKRREHWRDDVPVPAYFVPRSLLRPLDTHTEGGL